MTNLALLVDNFISVSVGMMIGYLIGYYEYPVNKKIAQIRNRRTRAHDNS
jgi:hypothetical protein